MSGDFGGDLFFAARPHEIAGFLALDEQLRAAPIQADARHGDTGLAVPVGDGRALAAAIRTMLDDPALREQFGRRGRQLIEEHYDSSVNVPRIFDAVKRQIDLKRAGSTRR